MSNITASINENNAQDIPAEVAYICQYAVCFGELPLSAVEMLMQIS